MFLRKLILIFLFPLALLAQTQKPYPGVDIPNTWTANNTFVQVSGTSTVVGSLGAASANPYAIKWVSDSSVIGTQGQTCVGGGTTHAMAFSNGTTWSCFGSGAGTNNQAVTFTSTTSATITANYGTIAIIWACWDSNNPANAIYPSNVTLNTSSFLMTFTFAVPQSGFCAINGSSGGGGGGGGSSPANPTGSFQYNYGGGLFGATSLTYVPTTACANYSGTCDSFDLPVYNSCINAVYATDASITYGNAYYLCNVADNSVSGGVTGSSLTIYSETKSPATGSVAMSTLASSIGGTNYSSTNYGAVFTDDPLDTGTGQTFNGFVADPGLTRAAGSISQMNGFLIGSPTNYATGSPTPGAETVTGFYGFHCADLLDKGTTTACLQIDAQTAGDLAINVASGGGNTNLQGTKVLTLGTSTNCAAVGTATSPSVASCGSASAGHFSCATNATGATCTVNTTAVTANSEIFVFESDTSVTGTALGVTCNTSTNVLPASRLLASSVAATSFTINLGTVTTNPACFSYHIVN